MQPLDLQVIQQAQEWLEDGRDIWFCTVTATFGSSPRMPGSLLVTLATGEYCGSLSGGCVEEDFLARVCAGEFNQPYTLLHYGGEDNHRSGVKLPCDGVLEVLVERITPNADNRAHLAALSQALLGEQPQIREIHTRSGKIQLSPADATGAKVLVDKETGLIKVRVGPVARLIISGVSPVAVACADFAHALGFEVFVCDPRPEMANAITNPHVQFQPIMPSLFIAKPGHSHGACAIVALTHDPRIDDLAMIEAVRTEAFYIGVMGSRKTSATRAARLMRSGGLTQAEIDRIHMPIGLSLGSKTPAEIALAVMADIIRVLRGRPRDGL